MGERPTNTLPEDKMNTINKPKKILITLMMCILMGTIMTPVVTVFAAEEETAVLTDGTIEAATVEEEAENGVIGDKAIAAAIAIGLAAAGGAIAMGMGIAKSVEGISRQPEAEGKIRTTLMLGLVFVETAIIYALVVTILIIFVL